MIALFLSFWRRVRLVWLRQAEVQVLDGAIRNRPKAKKPKRVITWAFLFVSGRGERIRTSGLYVPNVALYQAKLHPVGVSLDAIASSRDAHVRVRLLLWQAFFTARRAIRHKTTINQALVVFAVWSGKGFFRQAVAARSLSATIRGQAFYSDCRHVV